MRRLGRPGGRGSASSPARTPATYAGYLAALRSRREAFIAAGATSSDHGHPTARTLALDRGRGGARCSRRGLRGDAPTPADAEAFRAHMLVEFARMSIEDGLVMQLHPGAVRNHNRWLHATHGRDVGGDIPQADRLRARAARRCSTRTATTRGCGWCSTRWTSTRSPASWPRWPAATPALYLGAPWWFLDSPEALRRFREAVTETAGFYNTAGFVDDTRAFCSIPVRHDVARRVDAGFLARLVAEDRLPLDEAAETIADLAYHLPQADVPAGRGRRMTTITGVDVHDVRFPTAAAGDGSDAINRGDYSATYVELRHRRPARRRRLHLHQRPRQRDHLRGRTGAGAPRGRPDARGDLSPTRWRSGARSTADPQLRWLGPEKGVIHMATGALVNAVWDLRAKAAGKPLWRLLAEMPTEELVACVDFHHISDALTPGRGGRDPGQGPGRATPSGWPSWSATASRRTPPRSAGSATRTSKVRALTRAGVRRRLAGDEDEGRRRRSRTTSAGPASSAPRSARTRC